MKPYQGILAFISYFLLQLMVYFYISETYYTVIAGTIAVIVFAFMLYRKQMLHMSSRDLKGSQLLFCLGIGFGMSLFLKISILITVLSGEPIPELSVPDGFLWMATSVLLLPVVEELLVRGMLFGSFSRFISYPKAIVFSATFFLFGHTRVYLKIPQRCSILPKSSICCVAFACIPQRSAALMRLASGAFWRISQHV